MWLIMASSSNTSITLGSRTSPSTFAWITPTSNTSIVGLSFQWSTNRLSAWARTATWSTLERKISFNSIIFKCYLMKLVTLNEIITWHFILTSVLPKAGVTLWPDAKPRVSRQVGCSVCASQAAPAPHATEGRPDLWHTLAVDESYPIADAGFDPQTHHLPVQAS